MLTKMLKTETLMQCWWDYDTIQLWKTDWHFLKLKLGLLYDPALSVLDIYVIKWKTGTQIFVHTGL